MRPMLTYAMWAGLEAVNALALLATVAIWLG
jgi:hypothetical protein